MTNKLSGILNNINVVKDEFKIIAIRLLPNTENSIKKNLQDSSETTNSWYYFYNNFIITSDGVIKETSDTEAKIPQNMYLPNAVLNSSSNPKVNISAIVGMNGDGKSAIIELLIRIINNLTKLTFKSPIVSFIDNLNAELVYSIGNIFFTLSIKDEHVNMSVQQNEEIIGSLSKVELSSIDLVSKIGFYSLIVNYSQYAYNSNDFVNENNANTQEGCWISKLFHKNDAYQTPIVLNPYRDEGVVDINNENDLAKTRLISLILTPRKESSSSFKRINNKQEVSNLAIAYRNPSKYDEEVERWRAGDLQGEKDSKYLTKVSFDNVAGALQAYWKVHISKMSEVYPDNRQQENSSEDIEKAYQYLVYKTISISSKYEKFKKIIYIDPSNKTLNDETYSETFNKLIKAIWEDGSHITLKVRQTIAFILFQHLSISKIIASDPDTNINYISSQIQDCYEILGKQEYRRTKKHTWELIDLIPPPFLDMKIFLRETKGNTNQKPFPFSSLSSGEKQQVYSLSSILYHLRNLNSVEGDGSLIKYSYINIILEEIELYFHPEMQRQYIYHLLESIKSIDLRNIKAVNILFVTHSPFILSDIPKTNILRLKKGKPYIRKFEQTFGANISELLANDFFMENSFMGEFVRSRIISLLNFFNRDKADLNQIIEEYWDEKTSEQFINLIGEPLVKDRLLALHREEYPRNKEYIQEQIKKLQNELKQKK